MQYITELLSAILANIYYHCIAAPKVMRVEVTKEVEVLNPRGLCDKDIAFAARHCPMPGWKRGETLEEIAYKQGQQDMLIFFKEKVIGRRTDADGPIRRRTQ